MSQIIDTHWNCEFAKVREGEVRMMNGKHKLYKCPADKWTIGWGYNIEENGIDDNIAGILLRSTVMNAQSECKKNIKAWSKINAPRKSVLIDMCFNMGWPKLSTFKKMIAALDKEDYAEAAVQMEESAWFGQVGARAEVLQEMMLTGEYPAA